MVLVGHDAKSYAVINPCSVEEIDFDSNSAICSAADTVHLTTEAVESSLGKYMWYW